MNSRKVLHAVMLAALLLLALFVVLRPQPNSAPDPSGAADRSRVPADRAVQLDEPRSRAALRPCPGPSPDAPAAAGPLAGLVLPCLGEPGTVDLGAALAGQAALLNLWGPQCAPCVEEIPALAAYTAEPDAVPVLGVEVQRLPEGALHMLARLGVDYPSVSDPDGALRAALGAPAVLPLTYVVFPDGRVSQVNPPEVLRTPEQVRATVERYLGSGVGG